MQYKYDAGRGVAYARFYADYFRVPEDLRLFFYDKVGNDCANFISQCVWAAYGGWKPGYDLKTVEENKELIKQTVRMVPFVWFGSLYFSGSNKWCRVVEFHDYAVASKTYGPKATRIFEGEWKDLRPSMLQEGDVIQLVVASYAPYRYGHSLYVTKSGLTVYDVKICCHSYDRKDAPLIEFARFPEQYTRLRVLRFRDANFYR